MEFILFIFTLLSDGSQTQFGDSTGFLNVIFRFRYCFVSLKEFLMTQSNGKETCLAAIPGDMDLVTAMELTLWKFHSLLRDQRFHESAKLIEKRVAQLCLVLAEDCN
ncbi:unnamed protein product [Thlaspi arvense]|uniref:Uncharacterized protein n=1 Tax=Thlaspi arvense TaxID=13288 RepID=A0AAU9SKA5_THLAR|nr:unnamed protein product [Thlaspi arvense]